jgi:hypothetical protein
VVYFLTCSSGDVLWLEYRDLLLPSGGRMRPGIRLLRWSCFCCRLCPLIAAPARRSYCRRDGSEERRSKRTNRYPRFARRRDGHRTSVPRKPLVPAELIFTAATAFNNGDCHGRIGANVGSSLLFCHAHPEPDRALFRDRQVGRVVSIAKELFSERFPKRRLTVAPAWKEGTPRGRQTQQG